MTAKTYAALACAATFALAACHKKAEQAPEPSKKSAAIAAAEVTTPVPSPVPRAIVTPDPTTCGIARLQRYVNILPTATAKAQIAKVAGARDIRYISVTDDGTIGPHPDRLNVELGADGRIKRFACG